VEGEQHSEQRHVHAPGDMQPHLPENPGSQAPLPPFGHYDAHGPLNPYALHDSPTTRARLTALGDAIAVAVRRHWLAGVNTLLGTLIGVAALAPIGYALGLTGLSDGVFHFYRFLCGQTPSHSFYILGYQMCLCSRCLAIYSALLTGGILLALVRNTRAVASLDWKYWMLALVPMGLDGGTQLIGLRESNVWLRLFTGALFGLATAWFLFPLIEESSRDPEPAPTPGPTPGPTR
jgi:uncharacterized membrane protein